MLKAFANGTGQAIPPGQLERAVWIDLLDPTPAEIARVAAATGLRVPTRPEVSEIEASSRLAIRDGALYLSMTLIAMTDGPRAVSAGFVLTQDRLLTVRFAPSPVFDAHIARIPTGEVPIATSAETLIGLLGAIVGRRADALEQVHADLDIISHRIFSLAGKSRAGRKAEDRLLRNTLAEIGKIGDLISHIRESQVGLGRALPFIQTNTAGWKAGGVASKLSTLHEDLDSLRDFDSHLTEKLQFMLDATMGFINIAQNDVMKVMTIASVVGIPPVLFAGIYGMNFKNIHEYDWAWGYQYGLSIIVLSTLIPLGLFWWRKWI